MTCSCRRFGLGSRTRTSAILLLLAAISSSAGAPVRAQEDPFKANIRPTDPLTPDEERQSFHLPPGFEIQLVAAEPDIQKPMNLAFDGKGRLWVTDTTEYPYPVDLDAKGRDTIKVLEDTDHDGRADKITTFADGLNIPIGLYPYRDGAVAFSIPNIYRFEDTDGDGKSDKRTILYGPLGYERDTHGLNNGFRRGFDGWLYACHGFNNHTTIKGSDGSQIAMQSGNTYRVRLDGSRVEQFTWGQVNPFGMALDELGNQFTADCHSKPITALLRGGYYPSFGKSDDGLGFVPAVMDHGHGSTAIAGIAYYASDTFPSPYAGNLFVGNVMTSKVNRDTIEYHGSTAVARETPDFLTSDDPWFRPVDIRLGPDGALYVADFYNRIIGHYEVPLDHVGRDRHRGRIWRIVYRGDSAKPKPIQVTELSGANVKTLIAALGHANLTVRRLATDALSDRIGPAAIGPLRRAVQTTKSPTVVVHGLWALHRLDAVPETEIKLAAEHPDRLVRNHVMRILSETNVWPDRFRDLAIGALSDPDPFVQRSAADAIGQHSDARNIRPLLDLLGRVSSDDSHLRHVVRMSLRNQFQLPDVLTDFAARTPNPRDADAVASVCLGLSSEQAGHYLFDYVQHHSPKAADLAKYLRHAAGHLPAGRHKDLARLARDKVPDNLDLQLELFTAIRAGLQQQGGNVPDEVRDWGTELSTKLLDSIDDDSLAWSSAPLPTTPTTANPWVVQSRQSADGDESSRFLSSLPNGERLTGIIRSRPFVVPRQLRFYIAGHRGPPKRTASRKNVVRLRDAQTQKVLVTAFPPRKDIAQPVEWDLADHAGKKATLEIVDRDAGAAFAWMAVGRFEPAIIAVGPLGPAEVSDRQRSAAQVVESVGLRHLDERLRLLVKSSETDRTVRAAAARALLAVESANQVIALVPIIEDAAARNTLRERICEAACDLDATDVDELFATAMRTIPYRLQTVVAGELSGGKAGAERLLGLIAKGYASPRLLQSASVRDKIHATGAKDAQQRIEQLTALLPPIKNEVQRLLLERRKGYSTAKTSLARGKLQFEKHCAACHQIAGKGSVIGPQLDGIGNRGLERVLEDVLDSNRNVDVAFRASTYVLADGRVLTGLFRRQEGQTIVVADNTGKEIAIPKADIERENKSKNSLMPDNIAASLDATEFFDLIAYLLNQTKPAREPSK